MVSVSDVDRTVVVVVAAGGLFLYFSIGALYRLYLSPLASFPGPKLAALSLWYEFYFDVVNQGQYTWRIREMHQQYGPIVRINPFELHVDDPDYYEILFSSSGSKRDKWEWSAKMFGNSASVFGTLSHDHHRLRRSALAPYFSKASVTRLEPVIRDCIDKLCSQLRESQKVKKPVSIEVAFCALTMDIITEYSFGKSYGCLDGEDFSPQWLEVMMAVSRSSHLNKHFGWLLPLLMSMPESMTPPDMMLLINFQRDLENQIKGMDESISQSTGRPTLFQALLTSDLPPAEKTLPRLKDEGQTVVAAGAVTTAHYLKAVTFHILSNPAIHDRLLSELTSSMPNPSTIPPMADLEKLPYFNAVVKEGFRITYGATQRLQRISPDVALSFKTEGKEYVIPPGTPVGMTSVMMHENESLFPEPKKFDPERWLKGDQSRKLEKYLVNFSKGTRSCVGMNLAYAEIYLTLAAILRRFDLQLFETDRSDVDVAHDFFNPSARLDSKGCRVLVH